MGMESVTLKVNEELAIQIKEHYLPYEKDNNGEYVSFCADYQGVIITIYSSKKEKHSVTFIGEGALNEALIFDKDAKLNVTKTSKESKEWINYENQIGSDEVGVGDFLLPMIVVAAFVRSSDIIALHFFGVTDSKKLKDAEILEMGEALTKRFFFSKLTLSNEKYNEMIDKGENLNSLKAKMHNRALLNVYRKFPTTKYVFVDQFCSEEKYFSYLNDKKEQKVLNITFHEKGETYYPSVALASVIARYFFLKEKEKLEAKYNMIFPFGSGLRVDLFIKEFIEKYGEEELKKIAKKNFVNYKNIFSSN